ncbi:Nucleolar protein 9 [Nowakowskiella sp. JEL0407]|nr:Nucleolar protein 9 [Nowakowskiella sp. JEL0407]
MEGPQVKKKNRGKRGRGKKTKTEDDLPTESIAVDNNESVIETDSIPVPPAEPENNWKSHQNTPSFVVPAHSSSVFHPVSADLFDYLTSALNLYNVHKENDELENISLDNVFDEILSNAASVAADSRCSRVLEDLLKNTTDFQVRRFWAALSGSYADLFKHRSASHVCQTLLSLAASICDREENGIIDSPEDEPTESETVEAMSKLITQCCEELTKDWITMITDPYGSHLLRTMLKLLTGQPIIVEKLDNTKKSKQKYNALEQSVSHILDRNRVSKSNQNVKLVPKAFKKKLKEIASELKKLIDESTFRIFSVHQLANPVLQILVGIPETNEFIMKLLFKNLDAPIVHSGFVASLITHPIGSHFMEKLIPELPAQIYSQFIKIYFKDRFEELCGHPQANFVVQRLIQGLKNKIMVEDLFEELGFLVEGLVFSNKMGVVLSLMCACITHNTCQKQMVQSLMTAFRINAENKALLIQALAVYKSVDNLPADISSEPVQMSGALIIQLWLLFSGENGKIIADSFLQLPTNALLSWPYGATSSRILDSIITTDLILPKSKKKIVQSFHGTFYDMARDKYASHVLDKFWMVVDSSVKEKIAAELIPRETQLQETPHGRSIWRNLKLEQYKTNKQDWINREIGKKRKLEMFKEFEEDEVKPEEKIHKVKKNKESGDRDNEKAIESQREIDELFGTKKKSKKDKEEDKDKKKKKKENSSEDSSNSPTQFKSIKVADSDSILTNLPGVQVSAWTLYEIKGAVGQDFHKNSSHFFCFRRLPMTSMQWDIPTNELSFSPDRIYAEGGTCTIHKGQWAGHVVALKKLKNGHSIQNFRNEIEIMFPIRHPNIITVYGMCVSENILVLEFVGGGSLFSHLRTQKSTITAQKVLQFLHQITLGMQYLHSRGVLHGDLKSANILISELVVDGVIKQQLKITDFGMSKLKNSDNADGDVRLVGGTMAPECIQTGNLSEKADVYAFAMTAYEIITLGDIPLKPDGIIRSQEAIRATLEGTRPSRPSYAGAICDDELWNLICECWQQDPQLRPSFENVSLRVLVKMENENGDETGGLVTVDVVNSSKSVIIPEGPPEIPTSNFMSRYNMFLSRSASVTGNAGRGSQNRNKRRLIIAIFIVLGLLIGVVLGIYFATKSSDSNTTNTGQPSPSPNSKNSTSSKIPKPILPSGKYLVSASIDNTVRIWDMNANNADPIRIFNHTSVLYSVLAYHDKNNPRVFSGGKEGRIKEWNVSSASFSPPIRTFTGHTDSVTSMVIDYGTDGNPQRLFSGSYDSSIREWDLRDLYNKNLTSRKRFTNSEVFDIEYISIVPSTPPRLFSGSGNHLVQEWDIAYGSTITTPLAEYTGHTDWIATIATTKSAPLRLYSVGADNTIRGWDITSPQAKKTALFTISEKEASGVVVVEGTPRRYFAGNADHYVREWNFDVNPPVIIRRFNHGGPIVDFLVVYENSGPRLFSCGKNSIVEWDIKTNSEVPVRTFVGHTDSVEYLDYFEV